MEKSSSAIRRLRPAIPVLVAPVLVVIAGLAGPGGEQGQPDGTRPEPSFEERVRVELVLLEAVVVDKSGRHVRGLTADDFILLESGREVPIVSFDEVDLVGRSDGEAAEAGTPLAPSPASGAGDERASAQTPPRPAIQPPPEARQRTMVLLFDGYNNASALFLSQARTAAKRFLRQRMLSGDMAAIFEISPFLRSITSFSSDAAYLEDAIDDIRYFPGTSLGTDITDAVVYQGRLGSRDDIERRILNSATFAATQHAAERRQYVQSLKSLGEALEQLPGRKIVTLFSGGFPLVLAPEDLASGGFGEDFRDMVRTFQRSRTTLYSMNIGDEPALIDATTDSSYRDTLDYLGFGPDYVDRLGVGLGPGGQSSAAYNQFLAVLAHESGGRFFAGRDYLRGLRSVDDDSRHYYVLGYESTLQAAALPKGKRYRSIEVDVRGKNLRVATRRGRFVSEEPGRPEQRPPPAASLDATFEEPSTGAAVDEPKTKPPELTCAPIFFPVDGERVLVVLPLGLRGVVTPVPVAGGELLDISTHVVARVGELETASGGHDFRATLKPGAAAALVSGFRLTEAIELPAGRHDIEVALRLNGQDVEGYWNGTVDVPRLGSPGLEVAGVAIVAGDESAPAVGDVLLDRGTDVTGNEAGGDPFVLQGGSRVSARGEPVADLSQPPTLFFRVYNPSVDESSGMPRALALDYLLQPADGGPEILPPIELAYFRRARRPGAFDVLVRLDLGGVEPGSYDLRVVARDEDRDEDAEARLRVEARANVVANEN